MRADIRTILSEIETVEELNEVRASVEEYVDERVPYITLLQENAELKARIAELEEQATNPKPSDTVI
jgi:RNA processing factor Prp31